MRDTQGTKVKRSKRMKAILSLSGGMDSTTLLGLLKSEGAEVICVSFNYGQKHVKELRAADYVADYYKAPLTPVDLRSVKYLFGGSSLTSPALEIPEGHYEDETMKSTVVPNRNMIMLSLVTALAVRQNADVVAYAAHAGDYAIYPDCRKEFVTAMAEALKLCSYSPIELYTPFINLQKTEICKIANELNVPLHLTWSCYKGGDKHCGKCGTCVERKEAFTLADITDPTVYD